MRAESQEVGRQIKFGCISVSRKWVINSQNTDDSRVEAKAKAKEVAALA